MKKKIIEWFEIENELRKAMTYPGFAFQVWCTINADKIKKLLDVVKAKSTPSDEYNKFADLTEACKKKYCKVENGSPVIVDSPEGPVYVFETENKDLFEKEIGGIIADNKVVKDEYDAMIQEYLKFIREDELDIDIKLLNGKLIPTAYFESHPDQSLAFIQKCRDLVNLSEE
jgi:hypothetical protein